LYVDGWEGEERGFAGTHEGRPLRTGLRKPSTHRGDRLDGHLLRGGAATTVDHCTSPPFVPINRTGTSCATQADPVADHGRGRTSEFRTGGALRFLTGGALRFLIPRELRALVGGFAARFFRQESSAGSDAQFRLVWGLNDQAHARPRPRIARIGHPGLPNSHRARIRRGFGRRARLRVTGRGSGGNQGRRGRARRQRRRAGSATPRDP